MMSLLSRPTSKLINCSVRLLTKRRLKRPDLKNLICTSEVRFCTQTHWDFKGNESYFKENDNFQQSFDRSSYYEDKRNQEYLIQEAIRDNKLTSFQNIEDLKNEVLNTGTHIQEDNFGTIFLTICEKEKALDVGRIYFNSIYENDKNPNIGMIGKFFRLCYTCKKDCTAEDKNLIIKLYNFLLDKYGIFDSVTCENVVLALSVTSQWREIENVMKICRESIKPSHKMFSAYAVAAIENNDLNFAWEIMDETVKNQKTPNFIVYTSLLEVCDMKMLNDLMVWFEKNNIHIQIELADEIMKKYTDLTNDRTRSSLTSISPDGLCRKCQTYLHNVTISEDEFDLLKNAFLDPVLIGKDIFLKTKPEELQRFNKFLETTGKVDVVLDGLNIAYTKLKISQRSGAKMLRDVVAFFYKRRKKIIILGKKHMLHWPSEYMSDIKRHSAVFLTENVSQDDPFLLYAAMYSGTGTMFVSRDLMRGHKFLLNDPNLRHIFARWQQKHQLYILHVNAMGQVYFKHSSPYLQEVHKTEGGGWHLPILEDTPGITPTQQALNTTWLCLT